MKRLVSNTCQGRAGTGCEVHLCDGVSLLRADAAGCYYCLNFFAHAGPEQHIFAPQLTFIHPYCKCSECMRVCMACVRLTPVAFGRTRLSSIAQIGTGEISSWSSTALHPHFDASTYSFTSLVWSKYASTGLSSLVRKYFTC